MGRAALRFSRENLPVQSRLKPLPQADKRIRPTQFAARQRFVEDGG